MGDPIQGSGSGIGNFFKTAGHKIHEGLERLEGHPDKNGSSAGTINPDNYNGSGATPPTRPSQLDLVKQVEAATATQQLSPEHQKIVDGFKKSFEEVVKANDQLGKANDDLKTALASGNNDQIKAAATEVRDALVGVQGKLNATVDTMAQMRTLPPEEKNPYAPIAVAIGNIANQVAGIQLPPAK
jgi:hypothetical protein